MKIIADESVDFAIITKLRELNYQVISICETNAGVTDNEVLAIANTNKSLLITEDKDFGELVYRLQLIHFGILLIRLSDIPRNERIEVIAKTIHSHYNELQNHFSVLNKFGLRIKV